MISGFTWRFKARGICFGFVAHELVKVVYLECLGEVLIVVEGLNPLVLHFGHFEVESFYRRKFLPFAFIETRRHQKLHRSLHGKINEFLDKGFSSRNAGGSGVSPSNSLSQALSSGAFAPDSHYSLNEDALPNCLAISPHK